MPAPTADSRGRYGLLLAILATVATGLIMQTGCAGTSAEGSNKLIRIPDGAGQVIAQGKEVPEIPDRITGKVGDTLVIENMDSSTQFVAGYPVSPHQTLKIPLNRAGRYETSCSVHPESAIKMVISS
ncbi:MAG: hypothetical protein IPK93_08410 [Solirubrobacterales bacterium]|nr:hypothetical protein [Solirubrobacterales bacterium]